jgi:pimeloyl-ACP methyl ester carboxylesterase
LPTLDVPAERLLIAGSKPVTFPAGDGVRLAGRVFGPGSGRGVVLSHMGPEGFDQSAWWWMASLLADRGYSVLAFNFRGNCPGGIYGCSRGEANALDTVSDLRGAVAFLRSRGVESLVLGGASIGAMASLTEAGGGVPGLRGVVSLSGVELGGGFDIGPGVIRRIDVPTLFIAGRFDSEAAYAARRWGRAAAEPTETVIMETSAHGTDLFEDPRSSGHTRRLILEFAARYL